MDMAGLRFTFGFRSKIRFEIYIWISFKNRFENILSMVDELTIKLKVKPSGMILHGVNMKGFVRDKKGGV